MADVSFSVDVVLNMISKNLNQLTGLEKTTTTISKNTKDLGFNLNNLPSKNLQYLFRPLEDGALSAKSMSEALAGLATTQKDLKYNQFVTPTQTEEQSSFGKAVEKSTKQISPYQNTLASSTKVLKGYVQELETIQMMYGKGSPQAKQYFNSIIENTQFTAKELKTAQKNLAGFNFSFLSLIFGGIALEKTFGGAFKSLRDGYLEVADETDLFRKKTEGLADSFTLLKFTVFDAFANSPLVQKLIQGLGDFVTWLAGIFEANPTLGVVITTFVGALGGLGTVLFTLGTAQQLFMAGGSFSAFTSAWRDFSLLNSKKIADNASAVETSAGKLSGIRNIGVGGALALGALALTAVISTIEVFDKDNNSIGARAFNIASLAGLGALIGFYAFGAIGAGIGGIIGATVGVVLNIIDVKIEKKDREAFNKARELVQTDINTSFDKGITLSTEEIENSVLEGINSFRDNTRDELSDAFTEIFERKELNIITESDYRKELLALVGAVDKTVVEVNDSLSNIGNIDNITNSDIINGVKVLKDIDVDTFKESLDGIKTPLADFLKYFAGEAGLIVSMSNLLTSTQNYVNYIPTLESSLSTEGAKVDALTSKYKALAKAKKEAGSVTSASVDKEPSANYNFSPVGGGMVFENAPRFE